MADEFVKNEEKKEEKNSKKMTTETEEQEKATPPDKDSKQGESQDVPENIKEELKKSEEQYKRLLADFQNFQRRTTQEKEDIFKYASEKTLETLLPALDTLEYAKVSLNPEAGIEKIIKDMNLLLEMFSKCLKDVGIEIIEEVGIPFDPFYHEPLQQVTTNELPPHTVMKVLKKGYILNKKVIRPAAVCVSIEEADKNIVK